MIKKPSRKVSREKRHYRLRNKISGTSDRPRLCVFRSNKHIYAQIIDDTKAHTLVSSSTKDASIVSQLNGTANVDAAKVVGETIAKRALEKGIDMVVFDRGGYIYHGRVEALANSAREAGLKF